MKNNFTPEIRFQGFTEDWNQRRLSELMEFSNGINAPKESYGKGRKMISVLDILADEPIIYENIRNSVEVDDKTESKNKVEKGDLIFVRSSEIPDEVGWAKAYLQEKYALYSGFSIRGKKKSKFDSKFIELSLNYSNRKQIESKAGGSTRFNVSQSILSSVVILGPSIEEQIKIGDFFKKIEVTITLHQKELTTLKQTRQGFLQKMFPKEGESVPEVRFDGFSGEWSKVTLDTVIQKQIKGKAQLDKLLDGEVEYLDANRLNGGEAFYSSGIQDVYANNIIILWDGSKAGTVYKGFRGVLGSTLKAYSINEKNNSDFIYQQIVRNQEKIYKHYRTPNIPHVIKDFTDVFMIYITSLEEQRKIGDFFKQLDDTIVLHQRELDALKETKKAFLEKMFV